jgi:predicted Zn-ribbon and HTH transcriptional regulator
MNSNGNGNGNGAGLGKKEDKRKILERAVMACIGVGTSKELIKKAVFGIYDDMQKIINELVEELEKNGELKTQETKELLEAIQNKSESEKKKIVSELRKTSKSLLESAKELILKPFSNQTVKQKLKKSVKKTSKKSKTSSAKRTKAKKSKKK